MCACIPKTTGCPSWSDISRDHAEVLDSCFMSDRGAKLKSLRTGLAIPGEDRESEMGMSGDSLDGGTVIILLTVGVVLVVGLLVWSAWMPIARREREREEQAAREEEEKLWRIAFLGPQYAAIVESVLAAVKRLQASEAARTGWLGDDFDFTVDIRAIIDKFQQARALGDAIDDLSALGELGPGDAEIWCDAKASINNLEAAAHKRVRLIKRCAREARLIDKSLNEERKDALTAQQRAELHGKLRGMLYGAEATPDTAPTSAAADAVMARVLAYREVKELIKKARGS